MYVHFGTITREKQREGDGGRGREHIIPGSRMTGRRNSRIPARPFLSRLLAAQ